MRTSLLPLFAGVLASLPFTLAAQPSRGPAPAVTVRFSHSAAEEVTEGGVAAADVGVDALGVAWQGTAPLNDTTRLRYGAEWTRFEFDRPLGLAIPETLDEIAVDLGLAHVVNDSWRLSATISPGLYGDLEGDNGDAFNAPLLALAIWRQSPSLAWSFGFRADGFSDHPVLPIVGVVWDITPEWNFTIGMPRAGFTWKATPALDLGFGVSVQGGTYRISEDPRGASSSSTPSLRNTYLDYHEIRVGLAADYRLGDSVAITLEGGMITDQKFDYFDRDYSLNGGENAYFAVAVGARF